MNTCMIIHPDELSRAWIDQMAEAIDAMLWQATAPGTGILVR